MQDKKPEMKHFVSKLIPPRPTFHLDMSEEESSIMKEHAAYWQDMLEKGVVVVYGPVFDPSGVYGLGIIEAENENVVNTMLSNDPAVKSGLVRLEIYPMQAILRK
ncbi:MAG TPA: YciI family protein [Syntrophomonadaceae bacterium]|nr:YciI family protein [Syntrophomonadaceae bacterium]